jgi:SOS-response transcriptional repressor LexA
VSSEKRQKLQTSSLSEFGERVVSAYGSKSIREISEEVEIGYDKLRNYLVGRSDIPTLELVKIAKRSPTPITIDWLLTGIEPNKSQGRRLEKNVGPEHDVTIHKDDLRHLTDMFELLDGEIRKASEAEGITRGQVILKMVKEGLISRGILAERIRPMNFKMFTGKIVMIPVIGKAAAGKPIELYKDGRVVPATQVWPDHWDVKAVEIDGESMAGDDIHDGDVVLYRVVQELKPHDLALVFVEEEGLTLKRVRKGSNGTVKLESSNPDFEPMFYDAQKLSLLGIVIATLKMQ